MICNLSGHIHLQHIAASSTGFTEIVTSSLAVSPNQYGVLRIDGTSVSYHTTPVDVAAWAQEQGMQNPVLLDFSNTAQKFFWDTGYRQALRELQDSEDKATLASFFADVNTAYFAGRMDMVLWDDRLLEKWEARHSFLSSYLSSIAEDHFQNNSEIEFPFRGDCNGSQ